MSYKDPEDQRRAWRTHYMNNKEKYASRNKARKSENVGRVNLIKESTPCHDCGGLFPAVCMDFDHTENNKIKSVSNLARGTTWPAIQREIEKCELVCANCHRIRTKQRLG